MLAAPPLRARLALIGGPGDGGAGAIGDVLAARVIGLRASMAPEPEPALPGGGPAPRSPDDQLEAELMRRVAAGDRVVAMRDLVEIYSGRVHALGRRLLGDAGMAEELVQDTMVRVWRSAARFDPERGSVKTFVFTLARRAAIDLRRRSSARPLALAHDEHEDGEDLLAEDEYRRLLDRLELREAMAGLSEDHRTALEMTFDDDLTQPQIAERLGVPVGTVKSRVHHALRALRGELERRGVALDAA